MVEVPPSSAECGDAAADDASDDDADDSADDARLSISMSVPTIGCVSKPVAGPGTRSSPNVRLVAPISRKITDAKLICIQSHTHTHTHIYIYTKQTVSASQHHIRCNAHIAVFISSIFA